MINWGKFQKAVTEIKTKLPFFAETTNNPKEKTVIIHLSWWNKDFKHLDQFDYMQTYPEHLKVLECFKAVVKENGNQKRDIEDYEEYKEKVRELLEI